MSGNDLVAPAQDSSTIFTGSGPVESLVGAGQALAGGDWVDGAVYGVATGLETLSAIADPLGALFSAGIGFLIEHLEPFPSWMDELTGDPDRIHAFASTWHNIADRVRETADEFLDAVVSATNEWEGVAVEAYRAAVKVQATIVDGFAVMIEGVAGATEFAGAIVAGVRELVRDAISQLVGYALSKAAQLLTVVLAGKAIGEVVAKVAEWAAKISGFIKGLVKSMGNLSTHLDEILEAADDAGSSVKKLAEKWATTDVGNASYDFEKIFNGSAKPGAGLPTLANITYQVGSGGTKNAVDNRPH
ncbi:MAG: type secretion protein Rhs [Nocardioides sp.]|nr:type secretion protein Rhs [Nocardioides sp.]